MVDATLSTWELDYLNIYYGSNLVHWCIGSLPHDYVLANLDYNYYTQYIGDVLYYPKYEP
jgi:hypothetical protein